MNFEKENEHAFIRKVTEDELDLDTDFVSKLSRQLSRQMSEEINLNQSLSRQLSRQITDDLIFSQSKFIREVTEPQWPSYHGLVSHSTSVAAAPSPCEAKPAEPSPEPAPDAASSDKEQQVAEGDASGWAHAQNLVLQQMLMSQPGVMMPPTMVGGWPMSAMPPMGMPAIPMAMMPSLQTSMMEGTDSLAVPPEWANKTTLMLRNLPSEYNQQMLLRELNNSGFLGLYDFLYLPIDPETKANRGYAFINLIDAGCAWTLRNTYEGQKMLHFNSSKPISVVPAALQGFEANYAHYSNARVNRGDPAWRPLFLRKPDLQPATFNKGRRRGGRGNTSLIDLAAKQQEPIRAASSAEVSAAMAAVAVAQKAVQAQVKDSQDKDRTGSVAEPSLAQKVSSTAAATAAADLDRESPPDEEPTSATATASGAAVVSSITEADASAGRKVPSRRFCPYCGSKAKQDFRFCQSCGVKLDPEE